MEETLSELNQALVNIFFEKKSTSDKDRLELINLAYDSVQDAINYLQELENHEDGRGI